MYKVNGGESQGERFKLPCCLPHLWWWWWVLLYLVVAQIQQPSVDGTNLGVRRGRDVVRALALGATAVFVGRPVFWGLALGGEAGVARMIEMFAK